MKCLGFIIVSVLSINTIFAQNFLPPTLGVLDFEPRGIPTYVSQQFTQILREEIESEELGIVIERSTLLGALEERGYERSNCITDYCEALVGRLLNADFIVSGSMVYKDSSYIIDANMVSVRTGKLEHTETIIYSGKIEGLMNVPERLSYGIFNFKSPQELAEIEERKRMDAIEVSNDEIMPIEKVPFMFPTTLRSTLFPGWGQFYSDHRRLGWSILGAEAVLATAAIAFYKSYEYNSEPTKLTNQIEGITNYKIRKQNLADEIKRIELSDIDEEIKKKRIEKLDKRYTIGNVNFDSLIISDFDESLKSVITSFLYTDVSPEDKYFITLNQWFDESLLSEKNIQPLYFPSVNKKNLESLESSPNYRYVKGNITNRNLMEDLVSQCDAVVNFAAESFVDRSISDPNPFLISNIRGTFTLLETIKTTKKRFIQISTDEVYGSLKDQSANESFRFNPSSPYAATKAAAEHLVNSYVLTYDCDCIITRCTNNYGPRQFPEKLIPKTILLAKQNKKIPVYGNGKNIRDWLFVDDHCDAITQALLNGKTGESYNISAGNELDNLTIIKKILSIMDKPHDLIEFVEDRPGHDLRYAIDNAKINNALSFRPEHTLEEGLAKTIKWYSNDRI